MTLGDSNTEVSGEKRERSKSRYSGENKVLRYFSIVRPQIWDAPEHEKVAFLLSHGLSNGGGVSQWIDLTDALAELIPENREFWLRVQATWNTQFTEAMAAMFEGRK